MQTATEWDPAGDPSFRVTRLARTTLFNEIWLTSDSYIFNQTEIVLDERHEVLLKWHIPKHTRAPVRTEFKARRNKYGVVVLSISNKSDDKFPASLCTYHTDEPELTIKIYVSEFGDVDIAAFDSNLNIVPRATPKPASELIPWAEKEIIYASIPKQYFLYVLLPVVVGLFFLIPQTAGLLSSRETPIDIPNPSGNNLGPTVAFGMIAVMLIAIPLLALYPIYWGLKNIKLLRVQSELKKRGHLNEAISLMNLGDHEIEEIYAWHKSGPKSSH